MIIVCEKCEKKWSAKSSHYPEDHEIKDIVTCASCVNKEYTEKMEEEKCHE